MAKKRIHKQIKYLTVSNGSFTVLEKTTPGYSRTENELSRSFQYLDTHEWTNSAEIQKMVERFGEVQDSIKVTLEKHEYGGFLFHLPGQKKPAENKKWAMGLDNAKFQVLTYLLSKTEVIKNGKGSKRLNRYYKPEDFLNKLDEIEKL